MVSADGVAVAANPEHEPGNGETALLAGPGSRADIDCVQDLLTVSPSAGTAAGAVPDRLRSTASPDPVEPAEDELAAVQSPQLRRRRWATLAVAWRQLTSMRTALLLLFLLAIAAVPGSLFPQRAVNPLRVQQYIAQHPWWGPFLDRLSAFSVFSAPWFSAVYALLMISLIGCVAPRMRLHLQALLRQPPKAPARPARLPDGTSWTTAATPEQALNAARAVLRRGRYHTAVGDHADGRAVSAEKGYLRETGNLLFHFSLILLLVGVALGSLFGYSGSVLVTEGGTFTNTALAYDAFTPGPRVDPARLQPFSLRLDTFSTRYYSSGLPSDFAARVSVRPSSGAPARSATVRVNQPLTLGRSKIYLTGHGYSTRFTVRDRGGAVLFDDYVPCTPRGKGSEPVASTCTVKVPDTGLPPAGPLRVPQQLAFRALLTADPTGGSAALNQPALTVSGFAGDLHLNEGVPQNVYSLDMTGLKPVRVTGPAGAAQLVQTLRVGTPSADTLTGLPGGLSLTVGGVHNWAVFAVKHDPGKQLVLLAAILLLAGLITSLTVRRRRVWVRAEPSEAGGTLLQIGAATRGDGRMGDEFDNIVRRLRSRLPQEDTCQR